MRGSPGTCSAFDCDHRCAITGLLMLSLSFSKFFSSDGGDADDAVPCEQAKESALALNVLLAKF